MINFEHVTVTYPQAPTPTLTDVNLRILEGELALLVGRTGSGKSTILRAINGLVPHFSGGLLEGVVSVDGRDTRTNPPRELADVVGFVPQDPMSGFVTDTVEEELAYGMETLGFDPQTMRRRVEETLDLLGLTELRDRSLLSLSGGQRQRAAIGAVLTTHPSVLVLDEPTSALDPGAAEEVLAAIQRLVFDLGLTVLMAEHRLERVVQYADRLVIVEGGSVRTGHPQELLLDSPVAPPVVELGRRMGWRPLPLSVRDARRASSPWRAALRRDATAADAADATVAPRPVPADLASVNGADPSGSIVGDASHLSIRYGHFVAVSDLTLRLRRGEVTAVMGRNGAGKSTLLNSLVGLLTPTHGTVRVGHDLIDPAGLRGAELIRRVGLVPQQASDMLYAATVDDECAAADRDAGGTPGAARALLNKFAPGIDGATHPRDLSEGQRLSLVLAVVLSARPALLLLDEPTRGLDYPGKVSFTAVLRELAAEGHAIVMSTHDVELVAAAADRVVIMADGEIVADGPTGSVVVSSPMFAPQISKVMRPFPMLTVTEAVDQMRRVDPR
ncbi:MAG: ABC transporter ATP-binding protein [Candidatus Nanopelagicales bacterium]